MRDRNKILLLFLAAIVMTLPTVGVRDIITSHEGRVAQTARQMAVSGWPWNAGTVTIPDVSMRTEPDGSKRLLPDPSLPPLQVNPWIIPVISGEARLQKPPLPYWATAVSFKLFGVNEWAARVVPTMLWALLTLIVADLAAMLIHPRMAVWAAGVWISSYFGFDEFRKCMVDPYLAFFSIAAVWTSVRAMQNAECRMQNESADAKSSFCTLHSAFCILFYVFLSLAFLSKGPAAFVPVIAGIAAAWSLKRPSHWRIRYRGHIAGIFVFLLIALPWYAIVWHRFPNALLLWRYESLGGFGEKNEKPQPFWFYLPQLLLIALPWTPVWIAGIVISLRSKWRRGAALIWQGLIVLIFCLVTQKKNAYLLPATAAQTLVAVQGIRWLFAAARKDRPTPIVWKLTAILIALFAIGIAVGFPLYSRGFENDRSAKGVAELITRQLPGSGATLHFESLPPDAAFYLPMESPGPGSSNVKWVVIDDRHNTIKEVPRSFASLFPGRTVKEARRVPIDMYPYRWKVFEVTLGR